MSCTQPMQAHRTESGAVQLGRAPPREKSLAIPCGNCRGCQTAAAKAWSLRCHLELQQHDHAVFTTLTYDEKRVPPTLSRPHVQLWLKRLRSQMGTNRPIRFFASGEYGEQNQRPHYHALLYGATINDRPMIDKTWGQGLTYTLPITAAAINYVAGYTAKKLGGLVPEDRLEKVDQETGEVYEYQPPFLQMSRRPGIGGDARQHTNSWRDYAIHHGHRMPVPRFLHNAWKESVTEEEIQQLAEEKEEQQKIRQITLQMLNAQSKINESKHAVSAGKRKL